MYLIRLLIIVVGVLLRVAFFTLVERKVIGLMHYRKGPNKLVIWGISQPISDATKLLTKENSKFSFSKIIIITIGPFVGIVLMLICWRITNTCFQHIRKSGVTLIVILSLISLSPYVFILTGWGSNTKYALIGSLRAISQVISYEVCLILFVLAVIYRLINYKLESIIKIQENYWMLIINIPIFITWITMCIAERNRTPFDHAERERELVRGFNLEYGGGLFAVIFIIEYGIIMFIRLVTSILFIGIGRLLVKTTCVCLIFIWVRCCFPRIRYDKLIWISWKICLPYRLRMISLSLCT